MDAPLSVGIAPVVGVVVTPPVVAAELETGLAVLSPEGTVERVDRVAGVAAVSVVRITVGVVIVEATSVVVVVPYVAGVSVVPGVAGAVSSCELCSDTPLKP